MTEPICEVIITADSEDWLINFTRSLVEDRLVACGQHIAPIRSIYRWEGTIHDDRESRVALHTRASLVPAIIDRTRQRTPLRGALRSRFAGPGEQPRLRRVGHRGDRRPRVVIITRRCLPVLARTC